MSGSKPGFITGFFTRMVGEAQGPGYRMRSAMMNAG